ncbi:MAG: hypothetical protein RBR69_08660 [Candidatus Cloacimonadaceae bacterium]|jgi:hypothetical protein|nr:hypothetical protein [Candidatus Cloacimonadota bacterium]MCB5255810.1 hypothetical protein [Candidatus Cloacimonadota bacterium]MCK9178621.1 hypothetical protein [Candidatus Cloacimonadota bacterium]MCK9242811.1 hypothetical protein [Candidatus Cloacimonadota bacterium]MDY0128184.1 hypothetical protein [Candidatus Cloacimonadaceae bacterium]
MLRRYWLSFIIIFWAAALFASDFVIDETIVLQADQLRYQLSHQNIIVSSEQVISDSLMLTQNLDYELDFKKGVLLLKAMPESSILTVSYLIIPDQYTKRIQLYEKVDISDSISIISSKPKSQWFNPGSKLEISGSKTFAISFSESGETDLLQSLYVNLDGELAKEVFITAQLSDSQSKLSPEGDSKELSSLDQVFIRVYGKRWELGMGDLELEYKDSRYLKYHTKIEGLSAAYEGKHRVQAAFSAGGGKSAMMQMQIVDGKQGPYYLVANDSQRSFIIVAGTENIYLDGNLLERGLDYYIDYAEGSVMFRRLVSSTNTVNAWFQYSDENYRQSSYFTSAKVQLSERFSIFHHLVHQSDSKDNPLLYSFSEADLDSLAMAGDSPVLSDGVMETGSGDYIQLLDPQGQVYYEYAPGDSSAVYNVVFSYMGPGNGDYEEFSRGRYRWVGQGNGSWLPIKKLIAPTNRSNIELGLLWQGDVWQSGFDTMYSHNDQNTLSFRDDQDNSSAILSYWIEHAAQGSPFEARLDTQYRFADIYRFGTDDVVEHDFAALPRADSLAMANVDLSMGYLNEHWKPKLLLRYRDIQHSYQQKALRFSSESKGYQVIVPALRFSSTISDQSGEINSLLMYHDAELAWAYRIFGLKLAGLYSSMEDDDPAALSTRYLNWQPSFSIQSRRQYTTLLFKRDQNSVKQPDWQEVNSSDTYSIKHNSSFEQHRFDLDFSHREIRNPASESNPKSSYDLFALRSGHDLLSGAINLYNNYELNQTEFFPRIRDLVWVGSGTGVFDSTGVVVEGGEYIYEYITSPIGRLSTEISAMASLYLKPGHYLKDLFWKKIQSDLSITVTEQSDSMDDWRTYLFLPDYSYGETSIYARQSYLQNVWLDLYKSRIISSFSLELNRSLDNRYQNSERSYENRQTAQIDFRDYLSMNTRISLENSLSRESRYSSEISQQGIGSNFEKLISPQSTALLELGYSQEEGSMQGGDDRYSLKSLRLAPQMRSVFMQKYRVSARFSLGYNFREGSSYLLFLPQKRQGFVSDGTLSTIYRLNAFSSFSLEYRYSKYPKAKTTHNLKLEFKAEL